MPLERWLFALPGFDKVAYHGLHNTREETSEPVWVRTSQLNAVWVQNESVSDGRDRLADGIWIENHDGLIGWGTYEVLASHPLVTTCDGQCPNPMFLQEEFTIGRPEILDGLQINALSCAGIGRLHKDAPRLALPVTPFHASDIRIGADGMATLESLTSAFHRTLG